MTNSRFTTPQPITATLTLAGAQVRIAATDRPDTVVLVEPVDKTSKSDIKVAEKTKVDFSAGVLSVKTTKPGDKYGSVAITIELPAGSSLVLYTSWTDVRAGGPLGGCELHMASGQVQLDRIAALQANLAAGEVAIGHLAGTAHIENKSATVRVGEAEGTVKYHGSAGNVWLGHAWADLDLGSAGGSFHIERAEGSVTAKAGNCPIRIGRLTRGQANLTNASGGIEIGIDERTVAQVDAKSTKGTVRNSVLAQAGLDKANEKVEVYARTRLDDIVLQRAAR